MTSDERQELLKDSQDLCYRIVRFTNLYKELPSAQWDQLAERLGRVTLSYLEALIDEEFTELERAKELSDVI